MKGDEFIRAHPEFYRKFAAKIIRDDNVRKILKQKLPNDEFYKSWRDCTGAIVKKLNNGRT